MQKDFKIGLAIGVILAVGAVLWLATLPNLSAKARAFQAASGLDKKNYQPASRQNDPTLSSQTTPIVSSPAISQTPSDSYTTNDEPQVTSDNLRSTSNEQRTMNTELSQKIHIVQKGDTLSSISAKYYGSAKQWRKIVAANRDNLPDPNRLIPGVKLIIPQ